MLEVDPAGALDGVRDLANQPLEEEPERVRDDLDAVAAMAGSASEEGERR